MYTKIKPFYGDWRRFYFRGVFYSLVDVFFFCGRYAQKRTPNSSAVLKIINTSYQKLRFGSGDDPDKLFFHQALN